MTIPALTHLDYLPYLDSDSKLPDDWQGKIGVYAIFDEGKTLRFVGYSRDVYLSLKQHLARQPRACYWLKVHTVDRPSRTLLEEIRQAWRSENGGMEGDEKSWTEPIDARRSMTEEERESYDRAEESDRGKILKNIARRVESEIKEELENRGVKMEFRFNPKLKEQGLLDLK
ncbi:GIY-YIG nuclease family protein [Pannus brasiliensis CCIBt3594]|uniref:GIY-YIG nuclease family protein n=1 Tax=Pannus brasiliensis CCIBt3594 TaxID=1427578 RepID=A0AAW9QPJ4_9CHRO